MKAAVFAAGLGKRLRPLTLLRPKQLLPVAGKPILRRVLESLQEAGVGEAVIVVSYLGEMIRAAVESWNLKLDVSFVDQGKALGTGHALRVCAPHLEGDRFLVAYGDITLEPEVVKTFMEFYEGSEADGALEAVKVGDVSEYGSVKVEDSVFKRVEEKTGRGPGLANAGLYILPGAALRFAEEIKPSKRGEYELTDVLNMLAEKGFKILVHVSERDWWLDVGRPGDLLAANSKLLQKEVDGRCIVSDEAEIMGDAKITPPCIIGRGVTVGRGARIRAGTVLMDDVSVGAESRVEGSILLYGCSVGRRTMLRNVIAGDRAEIGDEVEIIGDKALVIAPGSRVENNLRVRRDGVYP